MAWLSCVLFEDIRQRQLLFSSEGVHYNIFCHNYRAKVSNIFPGEKWRISNAFTFLSQKKTLPRIANVMIEMQVLFFREKLNSEVR